MKGKILAQELYFINDKNLTSLKHMNYCSAFDKRQTKK